MFIRVPCVMLRVVAMRGGMRGGMRGQRGAMPDTTRG